ncbi:MAG: hypothetical protein ACRDRZ_15140 [Pseudonocardiaceae bacterium]
MDIVHRTVVPDSEAMGAGQFLGRDQGVLDRDDGIRRLANGAVDSRDCGDQSTQALTQPIMPGSRSQSGVTGPALRVTSASQLIVLRHQLIAHPSQLVEGVIKHTGVPTADVGERDHQPSPAVKVCVVASSAA